MGSSDFQELHKVWSQSYLEFVRYSSYMAFTPRNCFIKKCAGFKGFGFTLHTKVENEKVRGYINKIDAGSPAEQSGLLVGDRLVKVNGVNIEKDSHQQIIERIITSGDEVRLLVVDRETDDYYTGLGLAITALRAEDRQVDSEPNAPETQRNTLFVIFMHSSLFSFPNRQPRATILPRKSMFAVHNAFNLKRNTFQSSVMHL